MKIASDAAVGCRPKMRLYESLRNSDQNPHLWGIGEMVNAFGSNPNEVTLLSVQVRYSPPRE